MGFQSTSMCSSMLVPTARSRLVTREANGVTPSPGDLALRVDDDSDERGLNENAVRHLLRCFVRRHRPCAFVLRRYPRGFDSLSRALPHGLTLVRGDLRLRH